MNQLQMINRMLWSGAKSILETDTSLWLKADNPLNTNARWYDASPNNHVLTGTATLTDNVLNGQKGYVFNGTTNYFDGGDILDIGLNSRTTYIIAKTHSQTRAVLISKTGSSVAGEWTINGYVDNFVNAVYVPTQVNPSLLSYSTTSFNKSRAIIDRESKILKIKYLNTENTVAFNYTTNFNCATSLTVGAYNSSSFFLNGTICEIIVFDRLLTTAENTEINAYLNTKYGL